MLDKREQVNLDRVIEEFETLTRDAGKVQRETLEKILEENGEAEYLRRLGVAFRTDEESFKCCVPLVTHADLEPYINRIADGDTSPILTGKPIAAISLSSGTTHGMPKYVPFNDHLVENTMQVYRTNFAWRNREFPIGDGKALHFIYGSKVNRTNGGLDVGTATTHVFRSSKFKATMYGLLSKSCSPDEIIFSLDFHQSLYCHLLCGILFRDEIQFVSSTFAHSIVHAFRTFEHAWQEICDDIRSGVLSGRVTFPSIRTAMAKLLRPNPRLADDIRRRCEEMSGDWEGLIPSLFPNAKYVYGIMTGSMEPYLKRLRCYAGDLPLLSADYGSSEGWIGVNINPRSPPEYTTFTVLPNIGYFEFIPLRRRNGDPVSNDNNGKRPVGLTEVNVGEEYEIVLTNFAGLYRYRLGDVVRVMGFHNSTPKLRFICRKGLLLSVNIDKNTEVDLQMSIEKATKALDVENVEVVEFTSSVDLSTHPGHYVIYWELSGEVKEEVLKECGRCLDLGFSDAGYVSSRKTGTIGALELRILKRGTCHKILDQHVAAGGAVSQFKMPRCVRHSNKQLLQLLSSNVVESYFSDAYR